MVKVHRKAGVSGGVGVWLPCSAVFWFLMNHAFGSWGSKGSLTEIKRSVHLGMCVEIGVEAGCVHDIEGDEHLWDNVVLQFHWEVWDIPAQCDNKTIFESTDCTFSCVTPMDSGGGELEFDPFLVIKN